MTSNKYNCSFDARTDVVEPYGDVGGPGVLIGFVGTAYFSVILVILHYFVAFDPHENPFEKVGEPAADALTWNANPFDVLAKEMLQKGSPYFSFLGRIRLLKWLKDKPVWHEVIEKSILGMCDVQIVTGLGILISGYSDLRNGISAYHFLLVTQVAWFSNLTHICGLTVLRKHLHQRPLERTGRLFCMIALSLMLLVAQVPTLFFNWENQDNEGSASLAGSNAIYFFDVHRSNSWMYRASEDKTLPG